MPNKFCARTHSRHAAVSLCRGDMFDGAIFWRFSAVVPLSFSCFFLFFFLSLSLFDFLISLSPPFPLAAKEGLLVRLPAVQTSFLIDNQTAKSKHPFKNYPLNSQQNTHKKERNQRVYREIANSSNYTRALQTDVDHLKNWATLWQLRFNPEKCETMRIIHNLDKSSPSYTMGVAIKPVKCVKDLGLLTSYDLSWGAQVDFAVNKDKANKILGIVYRTIGPTNQEAFQYFVHNFSATYP